MNNEQLELLSDVYEKYWNSIETSEYDGVGPTSIKLPTLTKEEFINKCQTDKEFSEKRGLKIEERDLSINERGDLFRKTYPDKSVDEFSPGGMEVQSLSHQLNTRYDRAGIPDKLITITYNNKTIESYE